MSEMSEEEKKNQTPVPYGIVCEIIAYMTERNAKAFDDIQKQLDQLYERENRWDRFTTWFLTGGVIVCALFELALLIRTFL